MEHKLKKNFDNFPIITHLQTSDIIDQYRRNSSLIINKYFPNLNKDSRDILIKYTDLITFFLQRKFNLDFLEFKKQITMNNYRNIIAICNLLLPYIDDKNNFYNQNNISSFEDLIYGTIKTSNVEENPQKYCNYFWDHNNIDHELKTIGNKLTSIVKSDKDFSQLEYLDSLLYNILNIINSCYYKLYVNWINIFPIGIDYENSMLYKKSFKYDDNVIHVQINERKIPLTWYRIININSSEKENIENYIENNNLSFTANEYIFGSEKEMFYYSGIQVEDIYNTYVNDYYLSIKKNKWMLFEYNDGGDINIFISLLNQIFDVSYFVNQLNWDQLSSTIQNNINNIWITVKKNLKSKTGYQSLSYNILLNIFVTLISRFYSNYPYIDFLLKENQIEAIDESKLVGDEIEYNKKGLEYISEYLEAVKNLNFEYIYDYILISVNSLLNTPYKEILFNSRDNKLNIDLPEYNGIKITPKNFYNFGKSLTYEIPIDTDKDVMKDRYSFLWNGLSSKQKDIICLRLNTSSSNQNWFKITKILKKIHNYSSSQAVNINKTIYEYIQTNLIDLTFINLVQKGIISEFKYNPKVSDEKILTDDYFKKKDALDRNMRKVSLSDEQIEYYNKYCYYFANNKKYGDLDKIYDPKNPKGMLYLEHLREVKKKGDTWYTFYAMDWMCQIDFYLKFLNHRVLYITGATGQGKSTQVPKLTLYGLKAFYYKNNGKAICTQPRIAPTVENVKSISNSMGIPVETFNEKLNENLRTLNGIIQYKYADDSHVDENQNFFLRMVTDATLLNQMKQSPTLKRLKTHEKEINTNPIITEENLYDVLMVDEAHEHNTNMDIILTIARNSLLYNNDTKLLIISATMDDDEPIYRSYYRYIDDNLGYPISLSKLEKGISNNYIDRRFHISPPGKTTQFIVNDHFIESSPDTYKDNEELGIKKVIEIFNSTTSGDILFFSTTEKKILKICEVLNKSIPANCICLPYFAKMPKKYFEMVTNISSTIKNITIDKIDLVNVFTGNKKEESAIKVNKGTFSRAVVIATSVAEASLTIPSLRFVVDLGYQLTPEYDYIMKISKPEEIKITDASRMQRRGRVGRVAGGDVYYMYPKDSRKYVKGKFSISTTNFSDNFISLLALKQDDSDIIFNKETFIDILTYKDIDESKLNSYEMIIYNQYKINEEIDKKKLIQNETNLKKFLEWLLPSFKTGYSHEILFDRSGKFHIIHPFEGKIKREPYTRNILDFKTEKPQIIEKEEALILVDSALINLDLLYKKITNNEYKLPKTDLCLRTDDFMQKLSIYSRSNTRALIVSFILGILDEYIFCNSFMEITGGKIESLIDINEIGLGKLKSYKKFFEKNKKKNYDFELLISIYEILNNLINFEDLDSLYNNVSQKQYSIIDNLRNTSLSYNTIIENSLKNKLKSKEIDEILKLKLKGDFKKESIEEIKNDNPDKEVINLFISKIPNLNQYINHMNLNKDLMMDIIYKFICDKRKYNIKLKKYEKLVEEYSSVINIISNDVNNEDKLALTYLISNLERISEYKNDVIISQSLFLGGKAVLTKRFVRDYFGFKLTLVENLSPIILHLIDDGFGDEVKHGIFFNINKDMLLKYVPHLILIYNRLNDNFVNKSDYIKNRDFIIEKIRSNKKYKNIDSDQKKILTIFYNNMMDVVNKVENQKGGFYQVNMNKLEKIQISSLKKIPMLYEKVDDELKKNIDKFDYAYIHFFGVLTNMRILGIHLIKNKRENVVYDHVIICSTLNVANSMNYLAQHLHNKGNYLVIKIDMNNMLDDRQRNILNEIFK